jgi:WhiB family redox-sensing transcriptional regulator
VEQLSTRVPLGAHSRVAAVETPQPAEMAAGLCRGEDPELWFPLGNTSTEAAKAICRRCPARDACLAWAVAAGADHGIWGGLDEDERRALRRTAVAA